MNEVKVFKFLMDNKNLDCFCETRFQREHIFIYKFQLSREGVSEVSELVSGVSSASEWT